MSTEVFGGNGKLILGGYDLTTASTGMMLNLMRDAIDDTCMGADSWRTYLRGPRSHSMSYSGYTRNNAGTAGEALYNTIGAGDTIVTMTATATEGRPAYSGEMTNHEHNEIDGQVGAMNAYAGAGFGQDTPLFRGKLLGIGQKSATGNGPVVNLGAIVSGSNMLYAALHVTAASGTAPTLQVSIYSAPTAAFASPTLRLSMDEVASDVTAEIKSLTSTVTDQYWRAAWALGGTDPAYTIALNCGVITRED